MWVEYLRDRGLLDAADPAPVRAMSGGVSGVVVQVGGLLCKQPRERLAVDDDWTADPRRVLAEAEAMSRLPGIAPMMVDLDRERLVVLC
ncbi:hypothetical protein [Micromonospora echinofusca]|uniref:hypothetical protein n=1 Tax=Micromonospora echinofusca TaxID=47858 RepID=UPI001AD66B1A|nr:hypothetical protein [Micromonospora echinofusca]